MCTEQRKCPWNPRLSGLSFVIRRFRDVLHTHIADHFNRFCSQPRHRKRCRISSFSMQILFQIIPNQMDESPCDHPFRQGIYACMSLLQSKGLVYGNMKTLEEDGRNSPLESVWIGFLKVPHRFNISETFHRSVAMVLPMGYALSVPFFFFDRI